MDTLEANREMGIINIGSCESKEKSAKENNFHVHPSTQRNKLLLVVSVFSLRARDCASMAFRLPLFYRLHTETELQGNEAVGLRKQLIDSCDSTITIRSYPVDDDWPREGTLPCSWLRLDSLNASCAVAALLEQLRQAS